MQCLVCATRRPALDHLLASLKRVPGGQPSGTAIISANAEAFESYGLKGSLTAPTCLRCGDRFMKAANALLTSQTNRIDLGGAAFIFWVRERVEFSLRDLLLDPQVSEVRDLLAAIRGGGLLPEINHAAFYATVLSGNRGRAVVRDWIDTTVGEVQRHLADWFQRQAIVGEDGDEARPLGLYALAAGTVRDPRKDLVPPTLRTFLRAALTGTPLPPSLLHAAVVRNRAEQRVTRQRAAVIKLVLRSQHHDTEDTMVRLDLENPSPAYRCGRLLAVLEEVQRAAIPGANATVVDRFFGTASSAPSTVFGRLIRGAQPHLAKLERDKRGAYLALQQRLEEIQAGLSEFPRTLSLEDQGVFALGYYHQRASDRAQRREASERRKAAQADATETNGSDSVESMPLFAAQEEN